MLVAASQTNESIIDSTDITQEKVSTSEDSTSNFYNDLLGSLKIRIPRNSWLKSPDMRMEISGDLDLVKEKTDFEVFGSIDIIRGHYDLYGRRFTITEGEVIFQGGTEFNPVINLETEYIFRDTNREKRYLKFYASGKILEPTLKFTLDEKEISEGDAVSYIIFGRGMDELSFGQQSEIAGSGSNKGLIVRDMVSSLVTSELTKTIGDEFNLDIIEIKAQDNWQSAAFVVGKYLTNDLFVSYQKEFGETQDDTFTPETITVEYELTKNLFLQLIEGDAKSQGFDFIFKFER
jgi:autotransporter translocation and assembly factor TamB